MPNVTMPDGVTVAFPDDMPPEQIKGLIASKFPDAGKQPEPRNTGVGRTILNQAEQGATFGFADEIQAAIGAGYAKVAGVDGSLTDLYSEALDSQRKDLSAQMQERPVLSVTSNLGGALLTGGAAASTKAGQAVTTGVRSGGVLPSLARMELGRAVKGGAVGAASGATYGFGTADGGFDKRLEGAQTGAILGGVLGAGAPVVASAVKSGFQGSKNIVNGLGARTAEELDDAHAAIKSSSQDFYKVMKDAGATFTPKASQRLALGIEARLKRDGLLNPKLHDKAVNLLEDFKEASAKPGFGLEDLDQWRQLFGEVASNGADKVNARKARIAIDALDDAVETIGKRDISAGGKEAIEALKMGRAEWARASKFDRVADIIKRSDGDANHLKRGLKTLLDNPKRTRGFSKEELQLLKKASSLTAGEGIMKMLGKFGIDIGNSRIGSGVGSLVGSGVGYSMAGGLGGVAVPVIGTAARYAQKGMARGKAENLLQAIEGRATTPPVKAFPKPQLVPSAPAKTPTATDIKLLRGNKKLAPQFDEMFGEGAAAKALKK